MRVTGEASVLVLTAALTAFGLCGPHLSADDKIDSGARKITITTTTTTTSGTYHSTNH